MVLLPDQRGSFPDELGHLSGDDTGSNASKGDDFNRKNLEDCFGKATP